MPYIKIYEDDASDKDVQKALEEFMETEDYFEASNWQVFKLADGTFKQSCCEKCGDKYYSTLKEWQRNIAVYPDQEQWVDYE
jgi:hypothetical protein